MLTERIRGIVEAARIADEMDKSGHAAYHVAAALRKRAAELADAQKAEDEMTLDLHRARR